MEGTDVVEAICSVKDKEVMIPVANYGPKVLKLHAGTMIANGRRIAGKNILFILYIN